MHILLMECDSLCASDNVINFLKTKILRGQQSFTIKMPATKLHNVTILTLKLYKSRLVFCLLLLMICNRHSFEFEIKRGLLPISKYCALLSMG